MEVRGDYEVGKLIGESSRQQIYAAKKDGKDFLVKISRTFDDGVWLADELQCLRRLNVMADQIERLRRTSGDTSANPHYDWLVARLADSYVDFSQDDRRVNILEMVDASLDDLMPLAKLSSKFEIDTRTSVWILGRFLKLYCLHELIAEGGDCPVIQYHEFSPDDYLVDPQHHRLIYYNYSGVATDLTANRCVRAIAKYMLEWTATEDVKEDEDYVRFLKELAAIGGSAFEDTHRILYGLVDVWWGRKYHPFTYRNKGTKIWKKLEG